MRFLAALGLGVPLLLAALPGALGAVIGEAEFKAALLYNILQFIQWPAEAQPADNMLRLCLPEADTPGAQWAQLAGKTVQGRRLSVRQIRSAEEAPLQCDAVWIGVERMDFLAGLVSYAKKYPLLIVAEGRNSIDKGAAIGVTLENGQARLSIGEHSARHAGIEISARLRQLAARHGRD